MPEAEVNDTRSLIANHFLLFLSPLLPTDIMRCCPPGEILCPQVSSHSRKREHRLYQARERLTVNGVADDLSTETDVSPEGINASERKAAGCFKRQVALLRGLDRSSSPVPSLEPEVKWNVFDLASTTFKFSHRLRAQDKECDGESLYGRRRP